MKALNSYPKHNQEKAKSIDPNRTHFLAHGLGLGHQVSDSGSCTKWMRKRDRDTRGSRRTTYNCKVYTKKARVQPMRFHKRTRIMRVQSCSAHHATNQNVSVKNIYITYLIVNMYGRVTMTTNVGRTR